MHKLVWEVHDCPGLETSNRDGNSLRKLPWAGCCSAADSDSSSVVFKTKWLFTFSFYSDCRQEIEYRNESEKTCIDNPPWYIYRTLILGVG